MIWKLEELIEHSEHNAVCRDGHWVPARAHDGAGLWERMKAAWLVVTGKADAVVWPSGQ